MSAEPSGVDLARQALVAAQEAAKKNGAAQTKKAKRRTGTVVRRDGRDPLGLGAAIGMMMTERGMVAPAAGGSVLAQFDDILAAAAPELAGHVQTVGFDADTGRLDVAPDAPAYGTQLRWSAPKLIMAANEKVPAANVRALHVLAPAPVKAGLATAAAPQPTSPAAPMQRADLPEGYRQAIAAHRATWSTSQQHTNPKIKEAAERQLRERLREPEECFADGRQALEELRAKAAAQQRVRPSDMSRARALQRLAAERAGLATIIPAAASQRLDRTARSGGAYPNAGLRECVAAGLRGHHEITPLAVRRVHHPDQAHLVQPDIGAVEIHLQFHPCFAAGIILSR
ncbi:DciA family protein [Streptomyces sp. Ju416(a)]|uniref:DciA family protein n=1 Tax=Streptomyces sp. Ju416(a) TaxID=3446591 RepID=UPI00403E1946